MKITIPAHPMTMRAFAEDEYVYAYSPTVDGVSFSFLFGFPNGRIRGSQI